MTSDLVGLILSQARDWFAQFSALDEDTRFYAIMGAAGLVLVISWLRRGQSKLTGKPLPLFRTKAPHRWPWHRQPVIPLKLGPVTIDLQPTRTDTIHVVVGGISGTGKSTLVLPLFDMPIGILCVALDNTRPIANKVRSIHDGIEWTNEEDSPGYGIGLDLLSGRARTASEVLVAGWTKSSSDTGKYRDIASNRLWAKIDELDSHGIQRNFPDLAAALNIKTGNTEADRACQDWAGRLERLAKTLGPSLGNDLDLIDAMRHQRKVLLRLNRFIDPRVAPMLGGMLLVHARLVAQEAGVPFVLIIEEAGQMEQYAEHLSPVAQAGRDRGTPEIILTQNMSKLPLEVVNNVSVWCSFAQEARTELNFAAERLRLDPIQLQREAFRDQARGWCYVRAPGLPTTLVHIKQQKPKPSRSSYALDHESDPTHLESNSPTRRGIIIQEVEAPVAEQYPSLPPPSLIVQEILEQIDRSGHCWLWTGAVDKDGYGYATWNGNNRGVHRIVWELAYGSCPSRDENGNRLEIDHQCRVRRCVKLDHLELITKGENVRRMWAYRKRKGRAAI